MTTVAETASAGAVPLSQMLWTSVLRDDDLTPLPDWWVAEEHVPVRPGDVVGDVEQEQGGRLIIAATVVCGTRAMIVVNGRRCWVILRERLLNEGKSALTGLAQVGARAYDSSVGRFYFVDPVFSADSPQQDYG